MPGKVSIETCVILLSQALEDIKHIYDEFGDGPLELLDTYDMDMHQPVTHIRWDPDRQRTVVISDR